MHKSVTKCNETLSKWCKNKHGASKIMDMFETYHNAYPEELLNDMAESKTTPELRRQWVAAMRGRTVQALATVGIRDFDRNSAGLCTNANF
jgi:hypothetical protein